MNNNSQPTPQECEIPTQQENPDKPQTKEEKEKQRVLDEEKEKKRLQKKNKRDRKKQKKLDLQRELDTSREFSEEELQNRRAASKIWQNVGVPEDLKSFYVDTELSKVKVCVGNIPYNAQESELKEYFETIMITLKPSLSIKPPVENILIGETKNFAIVTLTDRESRNLFLKCDSLEYQGYRVKVQKPKGFFEQIYDTAKKADPFGNIQMGVEEGENQLYMGNIPTYLKDYEVKKICESFGMLKFFKLMQQKADNGEWVSKGLFFYISYCFFEYSDGKVTENALQGLNNLELGKNKLRVSRAQVESAMANVAEQHTKEASNVVGGSYLATYSGIVNPTIQRMLDIPLSAITPSKVVQFLNMATPDDLVDDEYYKMLCDDIYEECSKYGNVEKVEIPRPDLNTGQMGPNVGKVFVKFDYLIPAKKCRQEINGRLYNKKTVIASFYNEDKFNLKEYLFKL